MKQPTPASATLTTQQDSTYATLRQWVTVGKFLPGERLKIRTIAETLGTSTMPVRAALLRLAAEGALNYSPNRGVAVPLLSRAEFDDVLQNRLLLEGEAAERGALRLGAEDREVFRGYTEAMHQALQAGDAKIYLDVNEQFHLRLYRAAGSPILLHLIETVWLKVGPLSNQLFDGNAGTGVLNDAHEDLMLALDRKDASAARRAIERDLFVAGQFLRQHCTA
ncbi:MAG: GntR family transcriptional regulator [Pseudomonadota bacterium]